MVTKKLFGGFLLLLCITISYAAENSITETTIVPFFNALKNGDDAAIETYIDDPLHSQVKTLLQNNQEYPEFLRQYYLNSYMEIVNIKDLANDHKSVFVQIHFSPNEKQVIELQLYESDTGIWKITNQTVISE